ncbi:MAG: FHA domain-containing protein [Phycisphaera sp.]|nr:FHA domain-containing protein [Phycisphaera sp.]
MLILTVMKGPDKGRVFELPDNEPQLIGRSSESLPLHDKTISRRHAELTPDQGRWYIRDLKSANGTYVNGQRLTTRWRLQLGDQVRTGSTIFTYGHSPLQVRGHGVRVARSGEMQAHVEATTPSNDDSMIMAVPEPNEAAAAQLRVIYEMVQLIGSIQDRRVLLEKVMDVVFETFQADRGFVLLQESPDERPDPIVVRHRVAPTTKKAGRITISRTIVQHVMRKAEGVLSSNAMTDQRFSSGESVHELGIRSALCVPIKFRNKLYGVIHLDSKIANYTYTEDQLNLLTAIGVQTGLALSNIELYQEGLQQERLAAIGHTVASLSHSIKNMLQGLRGGADVVDLGMRKQSLKVIAGGWEIVTRNLERIYNLTTNMLTYSKQRRPELEMTSLSRLLRELIAMVQKPFDDKKVALIADFDANTPPVPVDPAGILQAVHNLLLNALEACEPESGVVTLRCEMTDDGQFVRIIVADNGSGIPPHNQRKLFEPFHSTKGMRGTGLGLVVTKKVVDEHGGTIEVESPTADKRGTTFTLGFPTSVDRVPESADTHHPQDSDPADIENMSNI